MIKDRTHRYAVVAALFALLAIAAATFLLPRVEAADCGGSAGGMSEAWLVTPESARRDSLNFCGPGLRCEQWCLTACGETMPQDEFRCVPIP